MTWLQAIWLGIVEGITEYLPVSSTGHLLLAQHALGMKSGTVADAYAICIQGGAIAAVLGLYAGRVRQVVSGLLGRDPEGAQLAFHLFVAFVPAAVIGLALDKTIEKHLFGPWPIVAAWFVGGIAILAIERTRRFRHEHEGMDIPGLAWRGALIIGFAQCLALWPGTSRSLVTIVAGVFVGLSLPAALEFSFLLGGLTLGAATAYKGLQEGSAVIAAYGPGVALLGFFVAWVSAVIAVRWLVGYLSRHGLLVFGYYRIGLAALTAGLLLWGVIR